MYPQPDSRIETPTVEYFAKEWGDMGHRVLVVHCPSSFPLLCYCVPKTVYRLLSPKSLYNLPSLQSRKELRREQHGITVYRIPVLKYYPGQSFSVSKLKKVTEKIKAICKSEKFVPDWVCGHFANPSLELVVNLSEDFSCMSSIVFHQDCLPANVAKYRIKENIKRIKAIGVRSRKEAENVKKLLDLSCNPFVCYSGVPNNVIPSGDVRCKKHSFAGRISFLFVGTLIPRKHVRETILAFSKFKGECTVPCSLTIAGEGAEFDSIQGLVSQLGLQKDVTFTGRVSREKVFDLMQECNVFTLISHKEVFGMVYIEAMLQGCLVIASRNEGFDGIIVHGENGFLCDPGDESQLLGIYDSIYGMTEDERNTIGQNAIETARHFSERKVAERYLNDVFEWADK